MELKTNSISNEQPLFENRLKVDEINHVAVRIRNEIGKVIVGQNSVIDLLLTALLANGHVLIEGVPGVAKTMIAKLLSKTINTGFSRIQFTPDLMPSDVLGTSVFNAATSAFEFNRGPIFSNMILIDEINRAPAKTQSALFEVMEERQVTVDGTTRQMNAPFIVLATQNPVEHEGTYRLPEAQLDRFLFKINIDYPSIDKEIIILQNATARRGKKEGDEVMPVVSETEIKRYQETTANIMAEPHLLSYIAAIVDKTRNNHSLYLGASTRASLAILRASQAFAALQGRDFVTPDDIREVIFPVLTHRIILSPEKEMEGVKPETVIRQILNSIEVPR
ncbi:MAG: MoxR family ATPase [Cytophagaceae bacterium]|jgi:MoxR-like ATPase|nr:MoxR family ATPase [Cytophagaceae bacterium]